MHVHAISSPSNWILNHEARCATRKSSSFPRTFSCLFSTGAAPLEFKSVSCEQAKKDLKRFDVLIDVREADEVASGKIEGSKHVTLGRVCRDVNTPELQALKGKKLLLYCRSGGRSGMACKVLNNAGFDVTNLEGGWNTWSK